MKRKTLSFGFSKTSIATLTHSSNRSARSNYGNSKTTFISTIFYSDISSNKTINKYFKSYSSRKLVIQPITDNTTKALFSASSRDSTIEKGDTSPEKITYSSGYCQHDSMHMAEKENQTKFMKRVSSYVIEDKKAKEDVDENQKNNDERKRDEKKSVQRRGKPYTGKSKSSVSNDEAIKAWNESGYYEYMDHQRTKGWKT